jgi:hypothetical protein
VVEEEDKREKEEEEEEEDAECSGEVVRRDRGWGGEGGEDGEEEDEGADGSTTLFSTATARQPNGVCAFEPSPKDSASDGGDKEAAVGADKLRE